MAILAIAASLGTATALHAQGEYRISFGKLPSGIVVKSISYGALDLLAEPLRLTGELDLREFRITLEAKP